MEREINKTVKKIMNKMQVRMFEGISKGCFFFFFFEKRF